MASRKDRFAEFTAKMREIAVLWSVQAIIDYDTQVFMPPAGNGFRPHLMSALAGISHRQMTDPKLYRLAAGLMDDAAAGRLQPLEAAIVRYAWRDLDRSRRLPADLVHELSETTSAAHHVWADARQKADFGLFRPWLEKIVQLKRREAKAVGYAESPYDALLDSFEPGLTVARTEAVFQPLADFLTGFIRELAQGDAPDPALARLAMPPDEQIIVCRQVAEMLGFDFGAGRLDQSAHPFSNRHHPGYLCITTHYFPDDLKSALYSTIHETGHALYEAGLPQEWFGLATGLAASYGIHESQSRFWENQIGHSHAFCAVLTRLLGERWPKQLSVGDFYRSINTVRPSLIRIEADEVTYNLHIILRFEIERDLIEGRLEVKDLPAAWNAKMRQYLGVEVPNDKKGVLQDVHWSGGLFGYFPSYALGNIYAAQLLARARLEMVGLDWIVTKGEFATLRQWLKEKVWRHGATLTPVEIIEQATDMPPSAECLESYLKLKYEGIYRLHFPKVEHQD